MKNILVYFLNFSAFRFLSPVLRDGFHHLVSTAWFHTDRDLGADAGDRNFHRRGGGENQCSPHSDFLTRRWFQFLYGWNQEKLDRKDRRSAIDHRWVDIIASLWPFFDSEGRAITLNLGTWFAFILIQGESYMLLESHNQRFQLWKTWPYPPLFSQLHRFPSLPINSFGAILFSARHTLRPG